MNHSRESKKPITVDETIEYNGSEIDTYVADFCSEGSSVSKSLLNARPLVLHYERWRSYIDRESTQRIYDQSMLLFENEQDDLQSSELLTLLHLATLTLCELNDQPASPTFDLFQTAALSWLQRDKTVVKDANVVEKVCAMVSLAEASFRPVPETISVFKLLGRVIDSAMEAASRGFLIRLAAQTCHASESKHVAQLIRDAIASPAEDLVISGVRAAAILLDRFAAASGLDEEVLHDVPSARQRECGVSRVSVEKACRDVFEFVQSNQTAAPQSNFVDYMDFVVEGFDKNELLRLLNHVYTSGFENCFQRTRNGVYRIAVRGLGLTKPWRDRAMGKSKFEEDLSREQVRKSNEKARKKEREDRHHEKDTMDRRQSF